MGIGSCGTLLWAGTNISNCTNYRVIVDVLRYCHLVIEDSVSGIDIVFITSDSTFNIAFPSRLLHQSGPLPSGFPTKKMRALFFYPTPSIVFKFIPLKWRWSITHRNWKSSRKDSSYVYSSNAWSWNKATECWVGGRNIAKTDEFLVPKIPRDGIVYRNFFLEGQIAHAAYYGDLT